MNVLDHLNQVIERHGLDRQLIIDGIEDLDERQAIVDESRRAEEAVRKTAGAA